MKLPEEQGEPLACALKEIEDGQLKKADIEDCTEVLAETGAMLTPEAEAIANAMTKIVAVDEINLKWLSF